MQTQNPHVVLMVALLLATGRAGVHGDSFNWEDDDRSYDRARRASERGEILNLAEIYTRVATQVPGRILEAELEKERGRWVYELKILDPQGRLQEVELDARTGKVLYQGENN